MLQKTGCDYCSEVSKHFIRNVEKIKITRRPNDEDTYAELCLTCLGDIQTYAGDLWQEMKIDMRNVKFEENKND